MSDQTRQSANLRGDVPRPSLQDYAKKYSHVFVFERNNGVLEARLHHDGVQGVSGWFNVWSQAWLEIGNDPENEVIILTASGDRWIEYQMPRTGVITDNIRAAAARMCTAESAYRTYYDALKSTENIIFGLNVPTLGSSRDPRSCTSKRRLCATSPCVPMTLSSRILTPTSA